VTHLPAPQCSRLVVNGFDDRQVGQGSPDLYSSAAQPRPLGQAIRQGSFQPSQGQQVDEHGRRGVPGPIKGTGSRFGALFDIKRAP
jgi:hypothetical protein